MLLRALFFFFLLVAFSVGKDDANVLCSGCQFAVNLVETQLKKIENVTKKDLTDFASAACAKIPPLELFKTLCTTVKDDIIDVAVQLIESVERQIQGNVTCKALGVCT